jgi:hypothetical protein
MSDNLPSNIQMHPNFGIMPAEARNPLIDSSALGAGIQGSFGVLSYKGKSWSVRYHGQNHPIWSYDAYGRPIGTVQALEVVILNVSPTLAKTYYEAGYVDGSSEAPDCWSPNAIVPDPSSRKLQAKTCAICPKNRFGSKITDNGSQSKACQDHKRMAIVPSGDMKNETFGGPMLLRAPPASLTGLLDYADKVKRTGWEWYALVTQLSFDPEKAFPLIKFHEVRPLNPQELAFVHELQKDARVARIINEGVEFEPLTPEQLVERGFTDRHDTPLGAHAPQPVAQPQPSAPPQTPTPAAPQGAGWGAPTPPPPVTQPGNSPPAAAPAPAASWGGPPAQTAPEATTALPAAAIQTQPPLPAGMSPEQVEQFLAWQRSQQAQAQAQAQPQAQPTPAAPAAEPAAPRTAKPRRSRSGPVSPGPNSSAETPAASTAAAPPPPTEAPPAPPTQPGAWGGGQPVQPNGSGAAGAPANDPGMAQFDDRLNKLL